MLRIWRRIRPALLVRRDVDLAALRTVLYSPAQTLVVSGQPVRGTKGEADRVPSERLHRAARPDRDGVAGPDLVGISQYTVYTARKKTIAEHGGDNPHDRDVAILVSNGPVEGGALVNSWVKTTQIAPTILELLGLNPSDLKAVTIEHTKALPLGASDDLARSLRFFQPPPPAAQKDGLSPSPV